MRLTTLLTCCVAFSALAKDETAKIFTDKGSSFFRTDKKRVLEVGAELDATDGLTDTANWQLVHAGATCP